MLKLRDDHPVKRWLKFQSEQQKPDAKTQKEIDLVNELLNSQFNLITDMKVKASVIALLSNVPENTNLEKLFKSYLYLLIGNVTKSDNYLKLILEQPPREFYRGFTISSSIYHKLTEQNLDKVLGKFARHPADRTTFYLFTLYLKQYANRPELLSLLDDIQPDYDERLNLNYTLRVSPQLVRAVRLSKMTEKRRVKNLRNARHPQEFQAQWVWNFIDLGPYTPDRSNDIIKELESSDQLWAIYLLGDEKIADTYFKSGGLSLSRRRQFLRQSLDRPQDFMLVLYKLIELGDVDHDLLLASVEFLARHE